MLFLSKKDGNMLESLEEEYYEGFTVLLTIMAYGEQDTTINFIQSTMN